MSNRVQSSEEKGSIDLKEAIKKILKEELKDLSGLLHEYRGRFLADDSLSNTDVLLLSLHIGGEYEQDHRVNYDIVKEIFVNLGRKEESFRKVVFHAKEYTYIEKENNKLSILVKGLKLLERALGQLYKAPVYIIKAGEHFTAVKKFESLLAEIENDTILLCDPYVSPSTLYPFTVLKGRISYIKILTSKIYESTKIEDYAERLEKESGINVEIKTSKKIHDRYMIAGDKCWSIGTSLKDLGNKDTMVKDISEVFSSLKDLFFQRW